MSRLGDISVPVFPGFNPALKRDRILVLVLSILSLGVCAAALHFASSQWIALPYFASACRGVLLVILLFTGLLIFGRFQQVREWSLWVLACGYLFGAAVVAIKTLILPQIISDESQSRNISVTLWALWHAVFPCFIAAFAVLTRRERRSPQSNLSALRHPVALGVLLSLSLAVLTLWLAMNWPAPLPSLAGLVASRLLSVVWLLNLAALALLLLCTRAQRRIDLWLIVVLFSLLVEISLSALVDGGRYGLGYYAGRVYSLLANGFVLGALLKETLNLHSRLATALDAERRHAHRATAAEGRLAAIFSEALVGLSELSLQGQFLHINPEMCRMLGYPPDQLSSLRVVDVTHPDDVEASRLAFQRLTETGTTVCLDKRYIRADGTTLWANSSLSLLRDEAGLPRAVLAVTVDLTARRNAEQAVRESEERFRSFAEHSTNVLWIVDLVERRLDYLSPAFETFYGMDREGVFANLSSWKEVVLPEDRPIIEKLAPKLLQGQPVTMQVRIMRPDGEQRWIEGLVFPIPDDQGRVRRMGGFSRDITQRKEAEQALRLAAERDAFRVRLFDTLRPLTDPVRLQHEAMRVLGEHLRVNRVCFGELLPGDEVNLETCYVSGAVPICGTYRLGQFPENLIASLRAGRPSVWPDREAGLDSRPEPDADFAAMAIGGQVAVPLMKAGVFAAFVWVQQAQARAFTDDEVALIIEAADRTWNAVERVRAEQAVRQSEERLKRALQIETVGVIFFRTSGTLTHANSAFLRMSGYSLDEVRARLVCADVMTSEQWMPAPAGAIQEYRDRGTTTPYEMEYLRKDGSRWWGLFAATKISEDEGVEFIIDITESKRAEEELRRARAQLEQRVRERTAELHEANSALREEIQERLRAEEARQDLLRQLVSAQEEERRRVSRELHDEVGQHLTALMLGLKSLDTIPLEQEGRQVLVQLQQITERVGKELHDLALELRPTALDDLGLTRTLSQYTEEWSARTRVEAEFHASGLDQQRLPHPIESTLYRIVQEALNNVAKHASASRVSVIVERRASDVSAIIEDNGMGFDVEMTMKKRAPRRLGLLGMQERVSLQEGTLSIESAKGSGTTIFVRIPLSEREVPDGEKPTHPAR